MEIVLSLEGAGRTRSQAAPSNVAIMGATRNIRGTLQPLRCQHPDIGISTRYTAADNCYEEKSAIGYFLR